MSRALGVTEFLAKKFEVLEFSGAWEKSFGQPERNFSMIIYGKSGNGKTEFAVMFAKYLTEFGKVAYDSFEQGFSRSLQAAWIRQNMIDVKGDIIVIHKESFEEIIVRLDKKKSPQIIFIDSIQYIRLTIQQWQLLRNRYPRKIFIMISHSNGDEPDGFHAKKIEYDVDIKVLVKGFQAWPRSRFGGGESYMIYEEGHKRWLARQRSHKAAVQPEAPQPTVQTNLELPDPPEFPNDRNTINQDNV